MNYYPSTAAWTLMWTDWQPRRIGTDFAAIRALGANAVRLILQPSAFGFPKPSAARLSELHEAVTLASQHGLAVQLTLFDWWRGYQDLAGSDQWARSVLLPYRDSREVAFVEVQNEIAPDDPQAVSWLRHELPYVQEVAGSIPVTVSVSGVNPLQQLAALRSALVATPADFYDLHFYGNPAAALATFKAARLLVAPAPLFVGETGASSVSPGSDSGARTQDLYLRTVEWAAHAAGLPPAAPWIFQDIKPTAVPAGAENSSQLLSYGLLDGNGNPKPAAASIRSAFLGEGTDMAFNNDMTVGSNGLPADWVAAAAGQGTVSWVPPAGRGAQGAAMFSRTQGTPDSTPSLSVAPVLQPAAPGERFRMTARARGLEASGVNDIAIAWYNLCDQYLGEDDSAALPSGTSQWRTLSVESTAPPGAAYERLMLKSTGNAGSVSFADVAFDQVGAAPPLPS
ncbi:hypothetical protein [Streptacidiphilus sp. MAP12-20]|uniref:hypothetical protein n=1 Tax=Streptacidiphilus sp. MAP12-20 TaxID=3156299 RepID=UPI0035170DFC